MTLLIAQYKRDTLRSREYLTLAPKTILSTEISQNTKVNRACVF
jgi:hypothetical protein